MIKNNLKYLFENIYNVHKNLVRTYYQIKKHDK